MIDWERLEQELADARRGERIADRIVRAARRRRTRRALLLGLGAAAVSAAVLVPLMLTAAPDEPPATTRPDMAALGIGHAGPTSVQAQIYAAALSGGPRPHPLLRRVWVRDHLCNRIPISPSSSDCRDAAIPAAVQDEVVRVLGPAVRFAPRPPVPENPSGPSVVAFGRLRVVGDRARLGMETLCGMRCGEGQTLVLRFHAGHWQVFGTTGPRWVS